MERNDARSLVELYHESKTRGAFVNAVSNQGTPAKTAEEWWELIDTTEDVLSVNPAETTSTAALHAKCNKPANMVCRNYAGLGQCRCDHIALPQQRVL